MFYPGGNGHGQHCECVKCRPQLVEQRRKAYKAEVLELRTQLAESDARALKLANDINMQAVKLGNTEALLAQAQAEKAELVRQCAQIVYDQSLLKEEWIAKYGDISVIMAILSLLPRSE